MPFIWDWIWEKLSGVSKKSAQPQGLGGTEMDHQVGKKIVRNRRTVSAKKGDTSAKPKRVRSNNQSKTGGKGTGKAVRATTTKDKTKSKAV